MSFMQLSPRTIGLIGEAASQLGHASLSTELMKAGLSDGDPGQQDRMGKSIPRDKRAAAAVKYGLDKKKWEELRSLADAVLNQLAGRGDAPSWVADLVLALRADGFDAIAVEGEESSLGLWAPSSKSRTWKVLPLGDEDVPLKANATALAQDLELRGLAVAGSHFDQAFASIAAGRWEAANGQLRATFENVLVETAKQKFAWTGDKGGQAIGVLVDKKVFDQHEHSYLKGLWGMSHTNGPHPGTSSRAEAELRMLAIVAAVRFILNRIH